MHSRDSSWRIGRLWYHFVAILIESREYVTGGKECRYEREQGSFSKVTSRTYTTTKTKNEIRFLQLRFVIVETFRIEGHWVRINIGIMEHGPSQHIIIQCPTLNGAYVTHQILGMNTVPLAKK